MAENQMAENVSSSGNLKSPGKEQQQQQQQQQQQTTTSNRKQSNDNPNNLNHQLVQKQTANNLESANLQGNYGTMYSCLRCGNAYTRPHSLNRHIRFECGVEPQFECPICHKKSKHKHNLLLHMRTHQKP
ncbi:ichor-like [Polistes fuscatus]|uniref:ichor-like n=1 Tax=Polistes fuscatus TaxID=30207 RepID=UPI001CA873FF|nr:ichor-like [Polistes fuscatus]